MEDILAVLKWTLIGVIGVGVFIGILVYQEVKKMWRIRDKKREGKC